MKISISSRIDTLVVYNTETDKLILAGEFTLSDILDHCRYVIDYKYKLDHS